MAKLDTIHKRLIRNNMHSIFIMIIKFVNLGLISLAKRHLNPKSLNAK